MAVIRDVMPAFELFQPSSVADAQQLLTQHGADAWVLAGGMDSFDWLKDRIKRPKAVVDLSGIEALKGVRATSDGIEIGAMTTLTDVVNNPIIKQKYRLLFSPKRVRRPGPKGPTKELCDLAVKAVLEGGSPVRFRVVAIHNTAVNSKVQRPRRSALSSVLWDLAVGLVWMKTAAGTFAS